MTTSCKRCSALVEYERTDPRGNAPFYCETCRKAVIKEQKRDAKRRARARDKQA